MTHAKIAVGLDIGTTKIVAIIGKETPHGKLDILGTGTAPSVGVKGGVVVNIVQTMASITKAVQHAEAASGMTIGSVAVGIAGQHIRSLQHSDYITREEPEKVIENEDILRLTDNVHKLVMMPGEEIIHVLPQEYKVDGQGDVDEPVGMFGGRLEATFHIVVGQVTSIRNIARCVKNSGLELGSVNLEPLASAEAVLSKEEKEAGVVLIDIGGGTTDVAIFKDGIIRHTAVIPHGGNIITQDIKEGCSIIEKQAEQLKIKFGSAWPGENKDNEIVSIPGLHGRDPKEISLKNLSRIIHARVTEIINAVFTEIKHYGHDQASKKLIAGVVITGGGSQLKHIKHLVEFLTGMDVRIGFPNEHLAGMEAKQDLNSPIYSTAVGLLMQGIHSPGDGDMAVINDEFTMDAMAVAHDLSDFTEVGQENPTAEAMAIETSTEAVDTPESSKETGDEPGLTDEAALDAVAKRKVKKRSFFDKWVEKFTDSILED